MKHPLLAAVLVVGIPFAAWIVALALPDLRWRVDRWRTRRWWRP